MNGIIELSEVTKRYGTKTVVDNLSLAIAKGSVTALLGLNGAGKTTAISMMLGLTSPSSGSIQVFGKQPGDKEVRNRIGALLQEVDVIDRLRVRETVELFSSYYANPLPADRLLQMAGLEQEADRFAERLSGGQKRRLQFALSMAGDPEVIFLDEPTVGMDIASRKTFWEMLRALATGGRTILLTTHYLEEADAIADRVVVIDQGRIAADGTPQELKGTLGGKSIEFVAGPEVTVRNLEDLPGVQRIEWSGRHVRLHTADTDRLLFALVERRLAIRDIGIRNGGLSEVVEQLLQPQGGNV